MENKKPKCFVIQQFDNDQKFDKRYHESIEPALIEAGMVPMRADKILGLEPIIQKIEDAIKDASICVAEVSTDNPNVWLELGYALALNRPVVILCDQLMRSQLPFDIQHRPIIFYRPDSPSGFVELGTKLKAHITNELKKLENTKNALYAPGISREFHKSSDLKDHEIAILAKLLTSWAQSPAGKSHWSLLQELNGFGHTKETLSLGILRLIDRNFIDRQTASDMNDQEYCLFQITAEGRNWLKANENKINLAPCENDIPF